MEAQTFRSIAIPILPAMLNSNLSTTSDKVIICSQSDQGSIVYMIDLM